MDLAGNYLVVRCDRHQSLRTGEVVKDGFETAAEAAVWRHENARSTRCQIARLDNGSPGFISTADDMEISNALDGTL